MNNNSKILKGRASRVDNRMKKIKKQLRKHGIKNKKMIEEILKEARNPIYRLYKRIKYKLIDIFKR